MAKRGPRSAVDRVRGLLIMLPWLMQRETVRIADMAAQFDISEADLIEDLNLASMCGTPPYTPFDLADLWLDDEFIHVGPNKKFDERLRLRAPEAFTLCVLASAAADIPGFTQGEHLTSALNKLQVVLGKNIVDVEVETPPFLEQVTHAATSGERLDIVYWTPSRNEESERTLVVRSVFSDKGNWYISADDSASGQRRHFRVDRIRGVTPTGTFASVDREPVEIPQWFAEASQPTGTSALTVVTAHVQAGAAWLVETYPCTVRKENSDGSFEVEIVVSSEHWLSRLLLRAGNDVTITSPQQFTGLAHTAAQRVLARYEPISSGS